MISSSVCAYRFNPSARSVLDFSGGFLFGGRDLNRNRRNGLLGYVILNFVPARKTHCWAFYIDLTPPKQHASLWWIECVDLGADSTDDHYLYDTVKMARRYSRRFGTYAAPTIETEKSTIGFVSQTPSHSPAGIPDGVGLAYSSNARNFAVIGRTMFRKSATG